MKFSSQVFAFFSTSVGLLTINFAISLPAKASITCEPGTIRNYSNGSLASCVLSQDMTLQVSSSKSGISNFPCKEQDYIFFDDKGQFQSCRLFQEIEIRQGNSVRICPAKYWVNFSISRDGDQSISCQP
ncbi:hypothetical protein [Cylindrospermum stagnale]|nr:hypothetical protein [Cylindrospermum stagnale]